MKKTCENCHHWFYGTETWKICVNPKPWEGVLKKSPPRSKVHQALPRTRCNFGCRGWKGFRIRYVGDD